MSALDFYTSTTSEGSDYFTNNSTTSSFTMSELVINDDWMINLADRLLFNGNGTAIMDAFCDVWACSGKISGGGGVAASAILTNQAVTKTVGWTILLLLKTVFFERRFDRIHRFLNLGSTLVPFAIAAWTIGNAMVREGNNDNNNNNKEDDDRTKMMMIFWNQLFSDTSPMIRNWIVASLVSIFVHNLVLGRGRSSKLFATIQWIPGMLAVILSLACRLFGETTLIKIMMEENDMQPGTLFLSSTLLRWTADIVTGWYCYAWIVSRVFGTNKCTSFPWFLMAVVAGRIAVMQGNIV